MYVVSEGWLEYNGAQGGVFISLQSGTSQYVWYAYVASDDSEVALFCIKRHAM
jgi:hypothetical protein